MATVAELLDESAEIVAAIEAPEGANPEVIDPLIEAWIEKADDKVAACIAVAKRLKAESDLLESHEVVMKARRQKLGRNVDYVRKIVTRLLQERTRHADKPLRGLDYSAWLVDSESVVVTDEAQLPAELLKVETIREPRKNEIKARLKAGAEIPGAHLSVQTNARWR